MAFVGVPEERPLSCLEARAGGMRVLGEGEVK